MLYCQIILDLKLLKVKKDCDFCNDSLIKQREVVNNAFCRAFLTRTPITKGHTLVVPKRCVKTSEQLSEKEQLSILELISEVKRMLEKSFGTKAFNLAWNEGEEAGQTVDHLHIHVVPRKAGDKGIYKYEPRKFLYRPGERKNINESELRKLALQIKNS